MKYLILVLVLISTTLFSSSAIGKTIPLKDISTCQSFIPYGRPSSPKVTRILCRTGFIIGYDENSKIPNWVSYTLDGKKVLGCLPRSSSFYVDDVLDDKSKSSPSDYYKTGYDIGHMANASDMAWSSNTETESFLMSNMTPQRPNVNRAVWKSIETAVRTWALSRNHLVLVISGSIYSSSSKKIGDNVIVPDSIYKIIIDETTKQYLAFIVSQINTPKELKQAQVTIKEIEEQAGISIPVPTGLNKTKKDKIWDISLAAYRESKQKVCKVN